MGLRGSLADNALFQGITTRVTAGIPRIFVYHNFCAPRSGSASRMDAGVFEQQMEQLARDWHVMTCGEYLSLMSGGGAIPAKSVILTIDDGYRDFHAHAFPVLKKFGIPATFFVTAGFVNRDCWLWPDQVAFALDATGLGEFEISMGGVAARHTLGDSAARRQVWSRLCRHGTSVSEQDKQDFLADLFAVLEVDVPDVPTTGYEASSWDEIREMSEYGIEIGNHTMTHPILSKVDGAALQREIGDAKSFIEEKIGQPVVSFCYPNSRPADINDEVVAAVRESGHLGAIHGGGVPRRPDLFRVPRMGHAHSSREFNRKLHGVEFLSLWLRS